MKDRERSMSEQQGSQSPTTEELLARFQRLPDLPAGWTPTWRFVGDDGEFVVKRRLVAFLDLPDRPAIGVSFGLINDRQRLYDGFCSTEFGGGGVATVPFVILGGMLWVLTTMQFRFLIGHAVDGFPRGYKPVGVSAKQHAETETREEFGSAIFDSTFTLFPLSDNPSYGASHIVDTRPLPNEPRPGSYQFGIRLPEFLFESGWQDGTRPVLKASAFSPEDQLEALTQGRVLRWYEAAECAEGVIHTGTLRLMATLRRRGIAFT